EIIVGHQVVAACGGIFALVVAAAHVDGGGHALGAGGEGGVVGGDEAVHHLLRCMAPLFPDGLPFGTAHVGGVHIVDLQIGAAGCAQRCHGIGIALAEIAPEVRLVVINRLHHLGVDDGVEHGGRGNAY